MFAPRMDGEEDLILVVWERGQLLCTNQEHEDLLVLQLQHVGEDGAPLIGWIGNAATSVKVTHADKKHKATFRDQHVFLAMVDVDFL